MRVQAVNAADVNDYVLEAVVDAADSVEMWGSAALAALLRAVVSELRAGRNLVLISGAAG